jgi:hypothetical protein
MALAEIHFCPESYAMATVVISASADKATKARMEISPFRWLELAPHRPCGSNAERLSLRIKRTSSKAKL